MIRRLVSALATAATAWSALASGPEQYPTPFVDRTGLEHVLAGDFPDGLRSTNVVFPLIVYLQLTDRFTDRHATLFRSKYMASEPQVDFESQFWHATTIEGHRRPELFATQKLVSRVDTNPRYAGNPRTVKYYIHNCQGDAFKTAHATLLDRRSRYGSRSIELSRWIEAQIKVFAQCSGERDFVPPDEPASDWPPLQQHDRRYQIAAAYFYNGQYLEAAARFGEIGRTADSPWQDLGRYLVGRSLAREAIINVNDPTRHLALALTAYRELADDPEYLAAFPSVVSQLRHIWTKIDPASIRREVEQRIFDDPASMSAEDLIDYAYLRRLGSPTGPDGATDYERWLWFATSYGSTSGGAVERWRTEQTLPWLYIALDGAFSGLGEPTLTELLQAAEALPPDTPGHLNILLQRIRILGLLDRVDAGLRLAEEAIGKGLDRSRTNRVRLAAARITLTWSDYVRWASLKPLSLPWTDEFARRLPANFNRITTDTTLFSTDATDLLNTYFTPSMLLEVIDTPGLSDYQRDRMAIAGWTRAMLDDDLAAALKLSAHIRRNVPGLDQELALFEQAQDKHFEAARIVFDYPAFSPWMKRSVGRVQPYGKRPPKPIPDHATYGAGWGGGWWCAAQRDSPIREGMLRSPRFSRYSDSELAAIRKVVDDRDTAATTSFGPHVIRYARNHLDDPRVLRTLHRLVFATRHACYYFSAPGRISQAAYALLHKHFPDGEWAEKTPYWYGRLD